MKTRASILILIFLSLGLAACADHKTREEKFADMQLRAEKGDPQAQYNLGLMYEQGYGVTPDLQKAAAWFARAAERGEANAQYRLGSLYFQGQGVPKDLPQAAAWYKKAAEQGNIPAQAALGNMYLTGAGVPRDISQAAYWHKKSLRLESQAAMARK